MSITAIIPARMDSTRFPGKILANATGMPLIQHVYEQTKKATLIDRIIVATDDRRIEQAVREFGGEAIMTRSDHPNGTSRIAEVVEGLDSEIIVNVQGDEPQMDPGLIDVTVQALLDHPDVPMATLASPFASHENPQDPNLVKAWVDVHGLAKLFSRSHTPDHLPPDVVSEALKHIGLYIYRATFLPIYLNLEPTPLEQAERLEQMRVLEHGFSIVVAKGDVTSRGVDTPEDYEAFVAWYRKHGTEA
ncbi:MAG: 3-deoxy-manno-octulosonate cytidylyltransferase [Planctomycetota bacterium]|nr:3-deoxy-manno-octulosonate cytidylyltransferase [Planctomycetota bacterium]